jgi:hypothetical protein
MVKRSLLGVVVGSLASAIPVTAQDSQQEAVRVIESVGQHAWTDVARVDAGTWLYVAGWAFECSSGSQGEVAIFIDGQPAGHSSPWRDARGDVRAWAMYFKVCDFAHTPYYSGVSALFLLSDLKLAPGWHTASIQIRNAAGVAMLSPNAKPFLVPQTR